MRGRRTNRVVVPLTHDFDFRDKLWVGTTADVIPGHTKPNSAPSDFPACYAEPWAPPQAHQRAVAWRGVRGRSEEGAHRLRAA